MFPDNYEVEEQLSIFDFPEYLPEGKEKRKAELLKKYGKNVMLSPAELYYVETGKTDYWSKQHIGCKYSGHACNKEELWNVADSLDYINCKKICCRQCEEILCGARCNGSE